MSIFDELEGMDDILDDFVVETNEYVDSLNEDLLLLEHNEDEGDLINGIFRAFHTIKGTSGFLSFPDCQNVSHAAEDVLNRIRNNELEPTPEIVDVLLDSVDWIKEFVSDVQQRLEKEYDIVDLVDRLHESMTSNGNSNGKNKSQDTSAKSPAKVVKSISLELPDELIIEFISESNEIVEILNNDLLSLEIEPDNKELINTVFRAFHTLKGNSGLLGVTQMSDLAHKSEDILNLIREKQLTPSEEITNTLLTALDWFKKFIKAIEKKKIIKYDLTSIDGQLNDILNGGTKKEQQSKTKMTAVAAPKTAGKTTATRINQTIRVDVERVDKLMNLAGELILERNRLGQIVNEFADLNLRDTESDKLNGLNNSLGFVTTEIQEAIMQMRMLPISAVFRKFPRLVRDLARDKKKDIDLVITGEETELDRSVIEVIGDPLVHLLRNAIDHGVEDPKTRENAGKPAKGTINLSAYQEGNQIVIELKDDGAGIDSEKVAKKALEKKIISQKEADIMTDRDKINLIFRAGFSTAKKITDVSGRGVGMDVVNTNIKKLNGIVDVRTEVGQGSTFTIKLPLTLAILTGLIVRSRMEVYIIPLISVVEILKYEAELISTIKNREVISFRDSILPLIRLDRLLNIPVSGVTEMDAYVVVVAVAERKIGLVVNELVGQEETVIKPLGKSTGKVPYISGGTIRGDGSISLIVDVPEMIDLVNRYYYGNAA